MESQQRINLRWPLGEASFVAFELYVADGSLPLDCFEQLRRVVEEIGDLVGMVTAPEAEVIGPAAEEINRWVSLHDDLLDDTPGMTELKFEAAEAFRRLMDSTGDILRPAAENVSERFPVGSLVRHRGFTERQGRVVGHYVFTGLVKVEMVSSPEGAAPLDGWYEGGDLELVPKGAEEPAPRFKIGQVVRQRSLPERVGKVVAVETVRGGLSTPEVTVRVEPVEGYSHNLDGSWPAGDLEHVPAPARKPLKVGNLVRSRAMPERMGRVVTVTPSGMVEVTSNGDMNHPSGLEGWYSVSSVERVRERDLF